MPRKCLKNKYQDLTQLSINEQSEFKRLTIEKTCLKCGEKFKKSKHDNYHLCKKCRIENMGKDED